VEQLSENDSVSIVVYAGASGMVLNPTTGDQKEVIVSALDRLEAGGSTNGGAGIQLAYQTAQANFIQGGVNRVILATDGDFNVGTTNQGELTRIIEEKAKSGVFLTVLGFGMGNYKDSTLEKLADKGNGNYAYIDTQREAKKVLVEQVGGTLITIAKDVKIQIDFNPAQVQAYRLIGYENRLLRDEDFNDDKKDAGEIGSGHTVTALYEIVPVGVEIDLPKVDASKYSKPVAKGTSTSQELLTVKLRYKEPESQTSKLLSVPVIDEEKTFAATSEDFQFAAAVAGFGMKLRGSKHKGDITYNRILEIAQKARGYDPGDYRKEFVELVNRAKSLSGE
jgi:Ca-activated chloride channel family protein